MVSGREARGNGYWEAFPETYRTEQIATIAKWLAVGDSGVVIGGSGTGKSNLVGFFTTRPKLVCKHLPGDPEQYLFLHMDVNSLPKVTTPYFYRAMIFAMQTAAADISPDLLPQIAQSMAMLVNGEDTLGLHFALQRIHDLLINQANKRVIWVIDRFDEACVQLESSTLNSLRNLRDHNRVKGRLSYVLFTRHPLARLRNPRDYDEFHEIVISNSCWVGPMVRRDAEWMAQQMADRHQVPFSKTATNLLIELSGGLPAFMKEACSALATGVLLPGESSHQWLERLLDRQPIQRNSQEMWDDLMPAEKETLSAIAAGVSEETLDAATIRYLEQASLVTRNHSELSLHANGNTLQIFSPIFELFVLRQKVYIATGISFESQTGALQINGRTLRIRLTPDESRLLAYLAERKGEICPFAMLIAHLWPDQDPTLSTGQQKLDALLLEIVKHLDEKLEQNPETGIRIRILNEQGCRLVEGEEEPQIHIAIDEDKFQKQVNDIVDSDFFRNLQVAAQRARQAKGNRN